MSDSISMAGPVDKKRPVVLRLAELQKYPTLDDRYAATLPFQWERFGCSCSTWANPKFKDCCGSTPPLWFSSLRAKCIKRTRERWAWFSSARKLDDVHGERLGTLIYLPWEIRRKIIKVLVDDARGCRSGTEYVEKIIRGLPGPLDRSFSRSDSYYGLWLASPSTRFEVKQHYFANTRVVFSSPVHLETFVDHLSIYEWSLLRSVTLDVSEDCKHKASLRGWMSACARLPPNLASIRIRVHTWILTGAEIHGQWFVVNNHPAGRPDTGLGSVIIFVNTLGKLAHRIAAKAKIDLAFTEFGEVDELRNTRHRVLDDLDPWSKDWLSWWEQETKMDFESDETFNKAA